MKRILFFALGILALCVLAVGLWLVLVLSDLPDVSVLKHYRPPAAAEVLDKDGGLITHYYDRKFRIWVPISSLPDIVIQAVVTAEDDTFFGHEGVNYKAVWEAFRHDVRKKRFSRGGSTITQQMIKNVLLSKEKTLSRKVREFVLARKAEDILTKRRILEIYLNEVEWGDNIYGIEAASRSYLDRSAAGLNAAEAAFLAGMLPNPRYFNPYKHLNKAKERQERVLFNMQQAKHITQEEYAAALQAPLTFRQEGPGDGRALPGGNGKPCYQQALERMLLTVFDDDALYRSGRTIRTTVDRTLQEDLNRWEETLLDKMATRSDQVLIVSEKGQVRAIVCATDSLAVLRDKLASPGVPADVYDVSAVAPAAITRDQIVLPAADEAK